MEIQVDETKMYKMVRKAVAEVFEEKLEEFKLALIPYADNNEMKEINSLFGNTAKYESQDFEEADL